MKRTAIDQAIAEAEEFVRRGKALRIAAMSDGRNSDYNFGGNRTESSALRRASMELTRALAEMRRP